MLKIFELFWYWVSLFSWDLKILSNSFEFLPILNSQEFLKILKFNEALENFSKAIEVNPSNSLTYSERGKITKWTGI